MTDLPDLVERNKVAQYLLLNEEEKEIKAAKARLKEELEPVLLTAETNARGSHVFTFSSPLRVGDQEYASLQRVRKESKVLNEERVIELLKDKYYGASPVEVVEEYLVPVVSVEHIDQDALWNLFVMDFLSQEEFDSFFDVTVSWAFQPVKV